VNLSAQLIYPMALYVFYIFCTAALMFWVRLKAIKSGEVAIRYFKAYSGEPPKERTQLIGRHYDNQFQVPNLFFAACILHTVIGQFDTATVILAWLFVVSRLFHSWIHLGSNRIQYRASFFATGWIIILILWAQLVYLIW